MRNDDPRTACRRYWCGLLADLAVAATFATVAGGALYVSWRLFG